MADVAAITAPFLASALARGLRPPVRILGLDARGWELLERSGDVLVLDEFGDLWWTKHLPHGDARLVRDCWPEEATTLSRSIREALARSR